MVQSKLDNKESFISKEKMEKIDLSNILQKYAIIVVWLIVIVIFSILCPDTFPTWSNITVMLSSQAMLVILSLAVLVPLVAGDFDLSTASTLVLASMVIAVLNVKMGIPIGIAILVALAVGVLVGVVNGIFAVKLNINSFIVTLGTGTLLNGITLWISNSMTITGIDISIQKWVIINRIGGIAYVFFYAIILCAILWYFFEYTAAGRKVLFVGRGINVARLSGINVDKVRWLCFVASGVISVLAGVMYAGITGSADPTSGLSFMMPAFAAAFLGSTCIQPGRFNPWGCLIAVYFLVTGVTGFSLMGVPTFIQNIFYGLALVCAVAFSVIVKRRQDNAAKYREVHARKSESVNAE